MGIVDVINAIPQQPQAQYDTETQLRELKVAAERLGLYDAADRLQHTIIPTRLFERTQR
jgi:hypothetical protein